MKYSDYYSETQKAYNQNADTYLKKTSFDFIPPPLKRFVDLLDKKSTVVDLGCGPGLVSQLFKQFDIKYLGLDNSEATIEIAKKIHPNTKFQVKDILNLDYKNNSVDAYIAIASLYHLSKSDFAKVIKNIYRTLKLKGKFYLVMKKGNGEYFKKDPRYKKGSKFVTYYSKKELINTLHKIGFKIVESNIVKKAQIRKDTKSNYENRSVIVFIAEKF